MNTQSKKPGALIIGVEPRITVPIARSLHDHGVPVVVAALSAHEQKISSRSVSRFVRLASPEISREQFLEQIRSLVRNEQVGVLIPATDAALAAVSSQFHALSEILHVMCPPPHVVERVLNKQSTLDIARSLGIRIPQEYQIRSRAQLESLRGGLRFPIVAKPLNKRVEGEFKVRYFDSFEQLADAIENNKFELEWTLLQEYCSGDGVGVEILRHKGKSVALFQHRRRREYPHTGGMAVVAESEALDPQLVAAATKLLQGLEWEGIAMVEFRHDRATGSVALMEVNGRYWGTLALAIQAGVDFPYYQYQLVLGQMPIVATSHAVGMRWRWTAGWMRRLRGAMVDCLKNRSLRPQLSRDLLQSLRDFAPGVRDAIWRTSDPTPAIRELAHEIKTLVASDLHAAFGRIRRTPPAAAHGNKMEATNLTDEDLASAVSQSGDTGPEATAADISGRRNS
jgi:predicted ATP-grasp superfamily ATP-dependent carboligase